MSRIIHKYVNISIPFPIELEKGLPLPAGGQGGMEQIN
jgi:hypothetical protein